MAVKLSSGEPMRIGGLLNPIFAIATNTWVSEPQFQGKETGDRGSWLVALAVWLLYLVCPIAQDQPLPWHKPPAHLTPQRAQQDLALIFAQFGSPIRRSKV